MAENVVQAADGRIWTADEFAREVGWHYGGEQFVSILEIYFKIRPGVDAERIMDLLDVRAKTVELARQGFPEGVDINDHL